MLVSDYLYDSCLLKYLINSYRLTYDESKIYPLILFCLSLGNGKSIYGVCGLGWVSGSWEAISEKSLVIWVTLGGMAESVWTSVNLPTTQVIPCGSHHKKECKKHVFITIATKCVPFKNPGKETRPNILRSTLALLVIPLALFIQETTGEGGGVGVRS